MGAIRNTLLLRMEQGRGSCFIVAMKCYKVMREKIVSIKIKKERLLSFIFIMQFINNTINK